MATEDSRDGFKIPRWGITAADVPSGFVTEPPGQKKDDGWEPGVDVPTGEWWNWLHQQASIWLNYVENTWTRRWDEPHVMRSSKGTSEGLVTAGAGLNVDVNAAQVWVQGAMYTAPLVANLTLAAAHATLDRFDLVVAELSGGLPQYAIVTGTPGAGEPTVGANQATIARVYVAATVTVPGAIVDRRKYGALGLGLLKCDEDAKLGDKGSSDWMVQVDPNLIDIASDGAGTVTIGNGQLSWLVASGILGMTGVSSLTIDPEAVTFGASPITRNFELPMAAFAIAAGSLSRSTDTGSGSLHWSSSGSSSGRVWATISVPNGSKIVGMRFYGTRVDPVTAGVKVELVRVTKTTNAINVLSSLSNLGVGGAGAFTGSSVGLSEIVDSTRQYLMIVTWLGSTNTEFWGAEVEYQETKPFDGI